MSDLTLLKNLESKIQQGITLFDRGRYQIWEAVAEVKRLGLWKETGTHESFESYCKTRWGWSKSNAYEVADAGRFRSELKESGIPDSDLPTSISQVRELKRLPPGQRVDAMKAARQSGVLTELSVRSAVRNLLPLPLPPETKGQVAIEVAAIEVAAIEASGAIAPEEVALILSTYDKATVIRRWQPEFGDLILDLAAESFVMEDVTAPDAFLVTKYVAAGRLEAISGRDGLIIKEAAAAIALGSLWLEHPDFAGILHYKAAQYFLPIPTFRGMVLSVLQKYSVPLQAEPVAHAVIEAVVALPEPSEIPKIEEAIEEAIASLVSRYGAATFGLAATVWLSQQVKGTPDEVKVKETLTLEDAIIVLASRCDGGLKRDNQGFNGVDAAYGHWLADRIQQGKPLLRKWAEAALKMLRKYQKTQFINKLPEWSDIESCYPEEFQAQPKPSTSLRPSYRIELHGQTIAAFSPYSTISNSVYKAIPGYVWHNPIQKAWNFPVSSTKALLDGLGKDLEKFAIDPEIEQAIAEQDAAEFAKATEIAERIIHLIEAAKLEEALPGYSPPRFLFPHQKEAAKWLLAYHQGGILPGCILADDMGLGKTISALVAAKAMASVHGCPIFVICPASLKSNWLREAEGVGISIEVFSWAKLPKPLETQQYILIADECHYMQDLRSARTKAALELARSPQCISFWGLTGTPIKNGRPINLFPLLLACSHSLAMDKGHYQEYFCNARQRSIGGGRTAWDVTGAAHLNELAQQTGDVMLRRKKSECINLPPKIRQQIPVELEASAAKAYRRKIDELIQDYRDRAEKGEVDGNAEALVTLNILRKISSEYKAGPAIDLAEELLEQGQPVVIFTEFLESAHAIHAELGGELLTGATPVDQRQALVDRFQSGESKVFVGTIKAGGVGITLTAASYVILVDRPWTPGDMEQAEDRCNRIGQTSTVNSLWLQYGEIDAAIDQLLEQKSDRIELMLRGKRKTLRGIGSPLELAKELLANMSGGRLKTEN